MPRGRKIKGTRTEWLIRRLWMDHNYQLTQQELADMFGLTLNTVRRVLRYEGKNFDHG